MDFVCCQGRKRARSPSPPPRATHFLFGEATSTRYEDASSALRHHHQPSPDARDVPPRASTSPTFEASAGGASFSLKSAAAWVVSHIKESEAASHSHERASTAAAASPTQESAEASAAAAAGASHAHESAAAAAPSQAAAPSHMKESAGAAAAAPPCVRRADAQRRPGERVSSGGSSASPRHGEEASVVLATRREVRAQALGVATAVFSNLTLSNDADLVAVHRLCIAAPEDLNTRLCAVVADADAPETVAQHAYACGRALYGDGDKAVPIRALPPCNGDEGCRCLTCLLEAYIYVVPRALVCAWEGPLARVRLPGGGDHDYLGLVLPSVGTDTRCGTAYEPPCASGACTCVRVCCLERVDYYAHRALRLYEDAFGLDGEAREPRRVRYLRAVAAAGVVAKAASRQWEMPFVFTHYFGRCPKCRGRGRCESCPPSIRDYMAVETAVITSSWGSLVSGAVSVFGDAGPP